MAKFEQDVQFTAGVQVQGGPGGTGLMSLNRATGQLQLAGADGSTAVLRANGAFVDIDDTGNLALGVDTGRALQLTGNGSGLFLSGSGEIILAGRDGSESVAPAPSQLRSSGGIVEAYNGHVQLTSVTGGVLFMGGEPPRLTWAGALMRLPGCASGSVTIPGGSADPVSLADILPEYAHGTALICVQARGGSDFVGQYRLVRSAGNAAAPAEFAPFIAQATDGAEARIIWEASVSPSIQWDTGNPIPADNTTLFCSVTYA